MTAAIALSAAEFAGVVVELHGQQLLLQASKRPPAVVVRAVVQHRIGIAHLLRRRTDQGIAVLDLRATIAARGRKIPPSPSPDWAEALAALSICRRLEGFSQQRWTRLLIDAERFVEQWGDRASELGWSLLNVFGVHCQAPEARYDVMGLGPLIGGGEVVSLTRTHATIRTPTGASLSYLKGSTKDAVPIWELARRTSERGHE
jgi:hypothetical protein